ncbi:MAG: 1-acyl-sn-glycerol-3-phosphate acyltransferase [Deltaproteobacteria bacterium]|nr:1-acyl-sn-glycerol-3-phosphate acyltransferase [Deltaproteobacteria bacterium]
MQAALSLVFWLFLTVSSAILFQAALLIWLVSLPFDRQLRVLHMFTCFWASLYTWINPAWRVKIEGRDRIAPRTPYIIVANHQSLLDILVMFRLFVHFKWVSKIEVFRLPFIGWNMSLNRYIKLRRGDARSISTMLAGCERTLRSGSSIMMFPEGTRSRDGRLRTFKHGAFTLARKLGASILPVVVSGTGRALPRRGFVLSGIHKIRIKVLEEIPADSWSDQSVEAMAEEVRGIFAVELGEVSEAVSP